jgi:hypothetical protein
MQKKTTPLRRSPQLAPLSRQHHDGLLFAWKIRQGIAYKVPPERIAKYCSWYWDNELRPHFVQEERSLAEVLPADDVLLNTMKDDHKVIANKIEEVIDAPAYYNLKRLAQIIYYHIRFEERDLFRHVEQAAHEQLTGPGFHLIDETKPAAQWTDEFWIKKPKAQLFETSLS